MKTKTLQNVTMAFMGFIGAAQAADVAPGPPPTQPPPVSAPASVASGINRPGRIGVGALLGEPIGASMKLWIDERMAVDAAAGWSSVDPDGFQLHGDFLYHVFGLFPVQRGELPLYFGVGGRVKFVERRHEDNRAGIRLPVGIAYLFPGQPFEVFAEVVPVIDVAPKTTLEWNGGVGFRYYF